jgi:tetratricopeptide (TPR) repeat protein
VAERKGRASGRSDRRAAGSGKSRAAGRSGTSPASSLYERYKESLRRGHVAVLRNRYDAALDAYSQAASIASDRALPHSAIGGVLARMDRLPEALAAYDRALALAPRDEAALRGRADVLAASNRRTEAAEAFDRLSAALDEAGRLPDAADAARRALELAESRERRRHIESIAGRLRESAGDEAAERALSKVLRLLEPPVTAMPVAPSGDDPAAASNPARAVDRETELQPEPEPEPPPDGIALGIAAEEALAAGDADAARDGLLAAARAHRAAGRSIAAIDACYLALAVAPADVDLHLLLAELYLERGWRAPAVDKLVLLGRLAELADDADARTRLCAVAAEQLPGEPRLAELCA